ncbi:MAG: hypothetical protein Q7S63_02385 [bacterium]|nr:hypothetical protein [bacterium]
MLKIQNWEIKEGKIPPLRLHDPLKPERGFLGIQNYATTSWGNLVGLTSIDGVMEWEIWQGIPLWIVLVSFTIGIIITIFCQREWMGPWHKPDWAYPRKGAVSSAGKVFIGYFFVQASIAAGEVLLLATGNLSWQQIIFASIGGGLYLFAIYLDIASGRWAKTSPRTKS